MWFRNITWLRYQAKYTELDSEHEIIFPIFDIFSCAVPASSRLKANSPDQKNTRPGQTEEKQQYATLNLTPGP